MAIVNVHGRKWGRGMRPWLLMPKYLCVSMALGGVAAIGVLAAFGAKFADGRAAGEMARVILWFQVFPAMAGATLFGVLLFLQHPRAFAQMRWLWVKLALVVVAGAIAHLLLKPQIEIQRLTPPSFMGSGALVALTALALVVVVGRLKPRLGQKYTAPAGVKREKSE